MASLGIQGKWGGRLLVRVGRPGCRLSPQRGGEDRHREGADGYRSPNMAEAVMISFAPKQVPKTAMILGGGQGARSW